MTLQEIQYKAQGIISKWRDDDSAPYIEFVEELALMIVPEPSEDLEEAAIKYADTIATDAIDHDFHKTTFIAGANWQKEQDEKEQADLFTIVALDAAQRAKEQMLKEAVEGEVYLYHSYNRDATAILVDIPKENLGDKVKIIIVKP